MAYYPFAIEAGAIYKLTNPNGAVATFNDQLDPNYVGMLSEVTGLDSPEIRESSDDLVESDGGAHGNFYFGRRPIVLNGRVFGHGSVLERSIRLDRARRASMALRNDSTLSWRPSRSHTNYISNPRAAIDTSGWITTTLTGQTTGGTITRVTGVSPLSGTTAFEIATGTTANQGAAFPINVTAGKTYFVGVSARLVSGTGTPEMYISSVGISGPLTALTTGTSFGLTVAAFTPTTTGQAYIIFRDPSTTATTFQISDVVASTKNIGYFDGDSPGFYWQGDPHASFSGDYIEMFTTVRRQQPFRETGAWNKDFQIALVSEYAPVFSTNVKTVSGAAGSAVSMENRGSWPSNPLLRVTGISGTNFAIFNTTTGEAVYTQGGLQVLSGEVLEIDTLNHTAYFIAGGRNGQSANRYINYGASVWPTIPTGTKTLTLSGSGTLTVAYRDTWV